MTLSYNSPKLSLEETIEQIQNIQSNARANNDSTHSRWSMIVFKSPKGWTEPKEVDLMKLQPAAEHPHRLSDKDFDALFTKEKPIVFAFHGYP